MGTIPADGIHHRKSYEIGLSKKGRIPNRPISRLRQSDVSFRNLTELPIHTNHANTSTTNPESSSQPCKQHSPVSAL
jgi:hypothetical protein